jgi:hemin uptake protein HemP
MSDVPQHSMESTTPPESQTPVAPALNLPMYESVELFQGSRVVNITHAGEIYRLLITRNNRLILQK